MYLTVVSEEVLVSGQAEAKRVRVTDTSGESIGPYFKWNRGQIGLTWPDEVSGQYEVFFKLFDSAGQPLREARRLTANLMASLIPAVTPWAEGFALV